jgi:hypothetical protein
MRVLRSIVHAQSLFMHARKADFADRRPIGFQFVGHDGCRNETLASKQGSEKFQCRSLVTSSLDEDVKDLAFAVDRAPHIHYADHQSRPPFRRDAIDGAAWVELLGDSWQSTDRT